MYIRKTIKNLFILMEKILFLVSDINKTYLFYISNILFIYKVYFFTYKNYNIKIIAANRYF